jgi:hypothetical protein
MVIQEGTQPSVLSTREEFYEPPRSSAYRSGEDEIAGRLPCSPDWVRVQCEEREIVERSRRKVMSSGEQTTSARDEHCNLLGILKVPPEAGVTSRAGPLEGKEVMPQSVGEDVAPTDEGVAPSREATAGVPAEVTADHIVPEDFDPIISAL